MPGPGASVAGAPRLRATGLHPSGMKRLPLVVRFCLPVEPSACPARVPPRSVTSSFNNRQSEAVLPLPPGVASRRGRRGARAAEFVGGLGAGADVEFFVDFNKPAPAEAAMQMSGHGRSLSHPATRASRELTARSHARLPQVQNTCPRVRAKRAHRAALPVSSPYR